MFNKNLITVFTLCLSSFAFIAFEAISAEKYVIDDLSIYLRRGPGTQYGLTGSLKSGDKVTVLETSSDGKFTRIKDDKGRISWVESEFLTDSTSLKELVPALEQEIQVLKEKNESYDKSKQSLINDYTSQLDSANQKIASLEKLRNELQTQDHKQKAEIEALSNQVDQNRQQLMLTWFIYGGLVAGIGLILGLILPLIIPKRRKKDRWMN